MGKGHYFSCFLLFTFRKVKMEFSTRIRSFITKLNWPSNQDVCRAADALQQRMALQLSINCENDNLLLRFIKNLENYVEINIWIQCCWRLINVVRLAHFGLLTFIDHLYFHHHFINNCYCSTVKKHNGFLLTQYNYIINTGTPMLLMRFMMTVPMLQTHF